MELTRYQKILLAVLAGMLAFFGVLMAVFRTHPGVTFEEGLLKITEQDGRIVYSGRVRGEPVTIAVTCPASFETDVEFTIGTEIHDICQVVYPTERIRTEYGDSVGGILVTKNGETFFEGGYDPESGYWYDADGTLNPMVSIRGYGSDSWRGYETTEEMAVRFAFGPETSARGDPALFGMAVFLTALAAAEVVFYRQLFRWRHWGARDPEPSEGYLALEYVGWAVFAAVIAIIYIIAMVQIG